MTHERQNHALDALRIARTRSMPSPGQRPIDDALVSQLVVLDTAERLVFMARLAAMADRDPDGHYWRRMTVIANHVTNAIADDVRTATTKATSELYDRLTAPARENP